MAKVSVCYDKIIEMAKRYGVDGNALFVAAASQYELQQKILKNIRDAIDAEDDLTVTKSYQKGKDNLYASPLIRELPKHSDSANKTLATMMEIIKQFGRPDTSGGKLSELIDE